MIDNHDLNKADDNLHKVSRPKTNKNKSNDLEQIKTRRSNNPDKSIKLRESVSEREKTLNSSYDSTVQYLKSSMTSQSEPNRQRTMIDHNNSLASTTTDNVQHKKARK